MDKLLAIDKSEVRRIAALANLELEPADVAALRRELQSILDHVGLLDELDVASIPPTSCGVEAEQRLRADEERPSLSAQEALGNAPDTAAGQFRVPRVLDG